MKIHSILSENFKLDGGASFGVVPKSIWEKTYPADENNMIPVVNRLLIIETENKKILIDCGIGKKQDEKYLSHFYISGNDVEQAVIAAGFSTDEITDVILTHLHFDHCGGAVKYDKFSSQLVLTFPKATYYCSKAQWDWAVTPNSREKSAYHKENFMPIYESGQLEFVHEEKELFPGIFLKIVNGHTQGQMIPMISYKGKTIVYVADFIPSVTHVHLPFIASFDVQPLLALSEKEVFLNDAADHNYILFFEHDIFNECCSLHRTEKGIRVKDIFNLSDI